MNTEPVTLSTELAHKGITLYLDSAGKLRCKAPDGIVTPDVIATIKEHRAELIASLALTPSRQDITEQDAGTSRNAPATPSRYAPWRPTSEALQKWDSYYGNCAWYKPDMWHDAPWRYALEYACFNDAGLCLLWNNNRLMSYYNTCELRAITLATDTRDIEPRQFTALLYKANTEQNIAMIRALASNFHTDAGVNDIIERYSLLISHRAGQAARTSSSRTPVPRQDTEPLPVVKVDTEPDAASASNKQWVTLFADIHAGRAITEQGTAFTFTPDCSLSAFLNVARDITKVHRVYLCGARPGNSSEEYIRWLTDAAMLVNYTTDKTGHFLDMQKPDASVARYYHRFTNEQIDIRRITSWLGDDRTPGTDTEQEPRYTIEDARDTLALLTRYVRQYFHRDIHLSGTPSGTFNRLWNEGNRIAGKKFTPLPDDIRALIHENAGQGRIEFFKDNSTGKLPGLFYYDGVFMYAALTWGLPTELATHDNVNEYAGKVPARYRVRFTVPENWQHVGLFMTRRENGWFYPGKNEQGKTYETWVDGSELDIAYNLPDDMPAWNITILERIVFKSEKESGVSKPLNTITEKIVKMREHITRDSRQDAERTHIYKLASGAARNILLHGIGSFNRQHTARSYVLLDTEPAPNGYTEYDELDEHTRLYKVPAMSQDTSMMHPEWAALVWARCRARLTKAALSLPYSQVIAIRTDAIAVTRPVKQWESNTEIGRLRRKWEVSKPLQAPGNDEQLDNIQRKVTHK